MLFCFIYAQKYFYNSKKKSVQDKSLPEDEIREKHLWPGRIDVRVHRTLL